MQAIRSITSVDGKEEPWDWETGWDSPFTTVIVGPGPMGLLGLQFAKLKGASKVALVGLKKDNNRMEVGKILGADYLLYSEEHPEKKIMELTGSNKYLQILIKFFLVID